MTVAIYIVVTFFAIGGILSLYAAVTGASWFFSTRSARSVTGQMPRTAARLFYGLIGAAIIAMAVYIAATA